MSFSKTRLTFRTFFHYILRLPADLSDKMVKKTKVLLSYHPPFQLFQRVQRCTVNCDRMVVVKIRNIFGHINTHIYNK